MSAVTIKSDSPWAISTATEEYDQGRWGKNVAHLLRTLSWIVLLLATAAPSAWAQFSFPVQPLGRIVCVYSAVPNQVRSEDLAARVGDARLDCTNDGIYNPLPGAENNMAQYIAANFTLQVNTAVSGLNDGTATSVVMIINDNNSYIPRTDSVFPASDTCGSVGASPFAFPDSRYPCPQQALESGPNSLTWNGVQFPVPGAPNSLTTLPADNDADGVPECVDIFDQVSTDSCFNVVTTVRMTGVIANAAAVGAGGAIFANLTISPSAAISVTPANQQTVANVFQGLVVDFDTVGEFQCVEGIRALEIELEEGFAGAFKTSGPVTLIQGDFAGENGYPVLELSPGIPPQAVGGLGGGATQATRFIIRLREVPEGVVPSVPNTIDEDATGVEGCPVEPRWLEQDICIQRVEGADQDGAGGAAGDGVGSYEVPLVNGEGQVIYELMNGDPFRPQSLVVPIQFACMAGSPTTSLVVSAGFAPISDEGESTPIGPVPRFVDTDNEFPANRADLQLTKTAELIGGAFDTVQYLFTIHNFGPKDATGVELVDILPDTVTPFAFDPGCSLHTNILSCDVGTIAANDSALVNMTASVDSEATGFIVNNAAVTSDAGEPTPDPHPNMDSATFAILPDLAITSLTAPNTAEPAGTINVSVDVANVGALAAGPFQLGFFFSTDLSPSFADPSSTLTCSYPLGLDVGASIGCAGPIDLPAGLSPGAYKVFAFVDLASAVAEGNEANNWRLADSGILSLVVGGCPTDLVFENTTLTGTQFLEATSTATLGPNLTIDGDNIVVRAPTVSIFADTSIEGPFTIGTRPNMPVIDRKMSSPAKTPRTLDWRCNRPAGESCTLGCASCLLGLRPMLVRSSTFPSSRLGQITCVYTAVPNQVRSEVAGRSCRRRPLGLYKRWNLQSSAWPEQQHGAVCSCQLYRQS